MTIIKPTYISKDSFQIRRILPYEDMLGFISDVKGCIFPYNEYRPEYLSTAIGSSVIRYYTTLRNDNPDKSDHEFVYATFIAGLKDDNDEDVNLVDYILARIHSGQYNHMIDVIDEYIDMYKFSIPERTDGQIFLR